VGTDLAGLSDVFELLRRGGAMFQGKKKILPFFGTQGFQPTFQDFPEIFGGPFFGRSGGNAMEQGVPLRQGRFLIIFHGMVPPFMCIEESGASVCLGAPLKECCKSTQKLSFCPSM
jgi:hypothetical protein